MLQRQMKALAIILALILPTNTAAMAVYSADQVKADCSIKWGSEYDMVKFCMDKRLEGYNVYKKFWARAHLMRPYFEFCEDKWLPEWDMVSFCAKGQIEGINTLTEQTENLPPMIEMEIIGRCMEKWPKELNMQGFCATKRVEAWRAINQ